MKVSPLYKKCYFIKMKVVQCVKIPFKIISKDTNLFNISITDTGYGNLKQHDYCPVQFLFKCVVAENIHTSPNNVIF